MARKGVTDARLTELLHDVRLFYLLQRHGGLDSVCDWTELLSGGEKQRIAVARALYSRPQFAILDECTSAVSVDVEAMLYAKLKQANITLFTVSHRKSVWQFHDHVLRFDGQGGCVMSRIDETTVWGS
jgi:ATP-binding cassette subfamily D (ALD) protein 3